MQLTVVTVTRNCAGSIGATLASVERSKREGLEYVVVDGESTDGTLDCLLQAGRLIDTLISESDTGIYNAMNKAVALARGRYVLFINGDDVLLPDGFDEMVSVLGGSTADVVCATTLVGSAADPTETLIAAPWKLPFYNSIPHPSAFTSTSLLRQYPFREDLRIASDYDFFLRCFLAGSRFKIVPTATALHHRGGASGNISRSMKEVERIRRERLGWMYPVTNALRAAYDARKWVRSAAPR